MIASEIGRVIVGLIGVCGFVQVFVTVIIVIFNGGEVRVMSTRSRFSAASVLAFAFFAVPTSVPIVNTFESVFTFAPSLVFGSPGEVYADV